MSATQGDPIEPTWCEERVRALRARLQSRIDAWQAYNSIKGIDALRHDMLIVKATQWALSDIDVVFGKDKP